MSNYPEPGTEFSEVSVEDRLAGGILGDNRTNESECCDEESKHLDWNA